MGVDGAAGPDRGAGGRIGTAAARGLVWAFGTAAAGRVLSLAGLVVLARLLAPEDFGLLAFALVVVTYLRTVGDLGLGAALIYWPAEEDGAAELTFAINLLTGLLWFAAMYLLAPAIASFFGDPDSVPILRVMALSFPIRALGNTHDVLLQRDLRFRSRAVPELGLAAVKAILSVALALGGLGVWSLVWGHLGGLTMWTLLLWRVVPWRPRRRPPRRLLKPMLRYGAGLVAVNVLAAVVHHADLVIVGRMMGAVALGFYQVAYKVPEMSVTVLVWVAGQVLFPTFARISAEGADLGRAYLVSVRYLSAVTLPAAAGLFLLAEPIVAVVFGERWGPAAPILRALAVYMGIRSLGTQAGDVMKGTGRTGLLAGLALVKALILVPALVVAGRLGASAVAATLAGVTVLTVAINLGVAMRLVDVGAGATLRALWPGAAGVTVMSGAVVAWTSWVLPPAGVVGLAGAVCAGATVYLGAMGLLFPELCRDAARSVRGGRASRPGTVSEAAA